MADEPVAKSVDPTADTLPSDRERTHVERPRGHERDRDRELADPLLGATLGHFRVDALLGRGGMGAVYRAWDTSLERPVALKTLLFDSAPARARFLREARAQAQLRHPHVVPIHFVGEAPAAAGQGTITYLVMDLVEGDTVAAILDRERFLAEDRALDVIDAVAQALEAAHARGLIHRDVKPSNILVEPSGRVLLADFGLVKQLGASEPPPPPAPTATGSGASRGEQAPRERSAPPAHDVSGILEAGGGASSSSGALTNVGAIVGTPTYLAPEQARGGVVDHRADIYALGVTLYELLTGEPPFTASTRSEVIAQHKEQQAISPRLLSPELRPDIERVVMRMLEKDPSKRFASYAELRTAIAAARGRPLSPAPFFPRLFAFAIDFVVFAALAAVAGLVSGLLIWPVAALAMGVVEARWGTTPGKRLMGLRTVDRYGAKPSYGRSILRALTKLDGPILVALWSAVGPRGLLGSVPGALVLVAWIAGFAFALGARHLALHDRFARTRVVLALKS